MDDELFTLPPITSWSYSTLKQFEKCPYSIYLAKVAKEPGPERDDNHPLVRGNRIHLEAEQFVRGDTEDFPHSLRKLEDDVYALRELYTHGNVKVEEEWGFDLTWATVDWTAPDVWCRMKLDIQLWHDPQSLTVYDWKTGKSWGNEVPHTAQGQTYAIGAFRRHPKLEDVTVQMLYTDEGKKSPRRNYTRHDITHYEARLTERALKLTTAINFPPKPIKYACQYCDFGHNKGTGACGFAVA